MTALRVRYVAYHEESGYATAARRAMRGLLAAGVELTWVPIRRSFGGGYHVVDDVSAADPQLAAIAHADLEVDVTLAHAVPEHFPGLLAAHPDAPFVGETVWETDRAPQHWPALLDLPDALVVPCQWNADVFRAAGVQVRIDVVPHLPPQPLDLSEVAPDLPIDDDTFVVYTINTWTTRKDIPRTIEAYLRAFAPSDPVLLVVKTGARDETLGAPSGGGPLQGSSAWSLASQLREWGPAPPVHLITRDLSGAELRGLHARGDCYLSLCRGEGVGLGAFDAAAFGKPVLMTGWGGQLDYLDAADAYLVDFDLVPVDDPRGAPSYSPDQRWAEASVAHAAELLREVFDDRVASQARGARLAARVERDFSARVGTEKRVAVFERAVARGRRR